MGHVYTATYELSGDARAKAVAHFEVEANARRAWSQVAREFGSNGFRPGYDGSPPEKLGFQTLPEGWRQVGRTDTGVEAVPNRSTKVGKAAAARLKELPRGPRKHDLTAAIGAHRDEMSDRAWHYSVGCHVEWPEHRYFVRVPRREGDGWKVPPGLTAIPESELMAAFEAHNAEARRQAALAPEAPHGT